MTMQNLIKPFAFAVCIVLVLTTLCAAETVGDDQSNTIIPHLRKQGSATQLIVDGEPFLMLAGELHNSSTSSVEYMKPIWPRLVKKNLNTAIAPVYWELIEPEEGKFDFTLVDNMIQGARNHGLRLVILWFGSWKNGASTYIPVWVKKNFERFPRAKDEKDKPLEILSTFSDASRDARLSKFRCFPDRLA